jgi:4-aminobutyrate aminotransferase-like enzyme
MLDKLARLPATAPIVGDVRGKGLLLGIELVADRASKRPLDRERLRAIFLELLAHGLLVMPSGSALRINPPLVLSEEQAAHGVAILERVLTAQMPV